MADREESAGKHWDNSTDGCNEAYNNMEVVTKAPATVTSCVWQG
jgi:hypothetical protein